MKKLNITDFTKTDELYDFLLENQDENPLYKKVLMKYEYESELLKLQSQLVNLQNWILTEKKQCHY